jgi:hypothetical protein
MSLQVGELSHVAISLLPKAFFRQKIWLIQKKALPLQPIKIEKGLATTRIPTLREKSGFFLFDDQRKTIIITNKT